MKSSAHTELTLVESQNFAVLEMAKTLEKEMKGKFKPTDLKSVTPINIWSIFKTVF